MCAVVEGHRSSVIDPSEGAFLTLNSILSVVSFAISDPKCKGLGILLLPGDDLLHHELSLSGVECAVENVVAEDVEASPPRLDFLTVGEKKWRGPQSPPKTQLPLACPFNKDKESDLFPHQFIVKQV